MLSCCRFNPIEYLTIHLRTVTFAFFLTIFLAFSCGLLADEEPSFSVEAPGVVLSDIEFELTVIPGPRYYKLRDEAAVSYSVRNAESGNVLAEGAATLDADHPGPVEISTVFKLTGDNLAKLREAGLPSEVSAKLIDMKDNIYPNLEDFLGALEVALGEEQAERYSSLILDHIPQLKIPGAGKSELVVSFGSQSETISIRALPAFFSILPPLLAILMALITRQVIVALFCGIWLGATFVYNYNPFLGFLHTLDEYIINALSKPDHVYILVFSLVLGGMVGVITRSGGTEGIVEKLSRYAKDSRGGQLATWLMGVLIFFDDYANTLIVGNTMRPLSDKLRISREKLSYLVDSTAAPVANIAIISTWIGYEISLISDSFTKLGIDSNAYITFIQTIPYNFYPIYALIFGLLIALMQRDFGPMLRAEYRAKSTGQVLRADAAPLGNLASADIVADEQTPKRWYNALVPVMGVILVVCVGLFYTGWTSGWEKLAQEMAAEGSSLSEASLIRKISAIVGEADSFAVLMWASFIGSITAIIMALGQRLLSLHQAMDAWVNGIRSMVMAAIILTAAWAIGDICGEVFTAHYVVYLTKTFLSPHWLPLLVFVSAGVIAFATGTSWGTMAILMPIAIPLAHRFPQADPSIDAAHALGLLLSTTAAVLAGATFGDHCSPISDTTIMSSMASSADHIDHVRTQLPYALTAGLIASVFGYIPIGFGVSNWVMLPIGTAAIFLIVRFVGKKWD